MRLPARLAGLGVALGTPLLLSACVVSVESSDYTAREQKRFSVTGAPDVSLTTFDGAVEVRAWDRQEVVVDIEKTGAVKDMVDAIAVVAEQEGNRVRVEARQPAARDWPANMFTNTSRRARLVASVPRSCNVLAHSGDGSIEAERIRGRVELRTEDGSVRGIDLDGDVHVQTGDGSVKLQDVDGTVDVTTGDGSIFAAGRLRVVRLRTGDGTVSLSAAPGSLMADAWEISSGDGSVVVSLPENFGAQIDATTGDGFIRLDPALGGAGASSEGSRRVLRTHIGDGTHVLRIQTDAGAIKIKKN